MMLWSSWRICRESLPSLHDVGVLRRALRSGMAPDAIAGAYQRPVSVVLAFQGTVAADDPRAVLSSGAAARFWRHVIQTPTVDGCLLWSGRQEYGWGRFSDRGYYRQATRVAYQVTYDDALPVRFKMLHTCAERRCVNLEHLVITRPRGHSEGEDHGLARLSDAEIVAIRQRAATTRESFAALARAYDINESTIRKIVYGQRRRRAGGPILAPSLAFVDDWRLVFLSALQDGFTEEEAAGIAGVDIMQARAERQATRDFAAAWLRAVPQPKRRTPVPE